MSQVWPDEELDARAVALVESLGRGATGALARTKLLVDGAASRSLEQHMELEHRFMVESGQTQNAVEGVTAFAQKRAPNFGR